MTDDEAKAVVYAVVLGCSADGKGATEEDIDHALEWAESVRFDAVLLQLVLEGKLALTFGEDPTDPLFTPAQLAEEKVEEIRS